MVGAFRADDLEIASFDKSLPCEHGVEFFLERSGVPVFAESPVVEVKFPIGTECGFRGDLLDQPYLTLFTKQQGLAIDAPPPITT